VDVVIKMPKLGDTVDSVLVLQWLVSVGDVLVPDTPLIRVETDKAEIDVEASVSGVVRELLVAVGDEVATGVPIVNVQQLEN
jgi:pyruvate/2-oxoglutarate dehydrogenase complex dihydrolipoamide acyltransferase (E2) component